MSNSPLVNYTKISPYKNSPRKYKIDTITIHCVVGQCSVEGLGATFSNAARPVSANYGIGKDGRIGLYVDEKDRSWCTGGKDKNGNPIRVNGISGGDNDERAITIEVASDTTHPYAVNDAAYRSLIRLLVDICKRNGIKQLKWQGNKALIGQVDKQNMTVHRWFANKSCPGDYLYNRHGRIAAEVNAQLGVTTTTPVEAPSTTTKELYRVRKSWSDSKSQKGAFTSLDNAIKFAKKYAGYSVFDSKGVRVYTPVKAYMVQIKVIDLNIRKGPGTNYKTTGKFTGKGVFTIVAEAEGNGSRAGWGKLKSGDGWISLDYATKI